MTTAEDQLAHLTVLKATYTTALAAAGNAAESDDEGKEGEGRRGGKSPSDTDDGEPLEAGATS